MVWHTFDCFLAGELPLEDLVAWIASTPALADVLAPDELRRLRLIDSAVPDAFRDATTWVAAIYEAHRPGQLDRDRAEQLASGMLAGKIDADAALERGRQLRAPALVAARRLLDRLKG